MKRNILKIMTLCTVAVLALASCKKDNGNDGNVPEKGFRATVEQIGDNGNNGSRTHINPENWNDGTTWPVLWTEGDQILVYNGTTITPFELQSGANTNDGIFMPIGDEEFDYESSPFCAVYCPELSSEVEQDPSLLQEADMLFNGTTTVISLPTTQTYKANSFAEGGMPMVAYSDGQTLEFKNLAGGLCFPIVSDRAMTIKTIIVESLDRNDKVSGYFQVDCSRPTSPMTPCSDANGPLTEPYVILRIPEGVTLDADNPVYFTVMVAPGSLERGFTMKALNENHLLVYEKTVDWSANPHTGFIPRSVIKKVNDNLEIIETDFAGLTFEAKTPYATVSFWSEFEPEPSLEYSINGTAWDSYGGEDIFLENVGDKVFFRGNNESFCKGTIVGQDFETGAPIYEYAGSHFLCSNGGDCYVYGNIMSILDKENFATATTVSERAFYALFEGNENISNHPEKPLVLPATTLNISCYEKMFKGCTGLTSAPELPATTLADQCYAYMFDGCTGLTAAPELPATTLNGECYYSMFSGCTGLTVAPALPAETLAIRCYAYMFKGCTSLTAAPVLPATTLANDCYWFMFENCTGLTAAPELPATTLVGSCYQGMFKNCSNLNYIKCLATNISASYCTQNWVQGVSSTGTFVKDPSMTRWTTGNNGIPSGWTVQDASL